MANGVPPWRCPACQEEHPANWKICAASGESRNETANMGKQTPVFSYDVITENVYQDERIRKGAADTMMPACGRPQAERREGGGKDGGAKDVEYDMGKGTKTRQPAGSRKLQEHTLFPEENAQQNADTLMAEFLAARRKEKQEMQQIFLRSHSARSSTMKDNSFVFATSECDGTRPSIFNGLLFGGMKPSVFDNPYAFESIKHQITSLLREKGKAKRKEDLGYLLSNEPRLARAWSLIGNPPFAVSWIHQNDDILFYLSADPKRKGWVMNSVVMRDNIFGMWGREEYLPFEKFAEHQDLNLKATVSVDELGFKLSWGGGVRHVFAHRQAWVSMTFDRFEIDGEVDVAEIDPAVELAGNVSALPLDNVSTLSSQPLASKPPAPRPSILNFETRSKAFWIQYHLIFGLQMRQISAYSTQAAISFIFSPIPGRSKIACWSARTLATMQSKNTAAPAAQETRGGLMQYQITYHTQMQRILALSSSNAALYLITIPTPGHTRMARWSQRALANRKANRLEHQSLVSFLAHSRYLTLHPNKLVAASIPGP